MDHLEVLREKMGRLREEVAHLRALSEQYRRRGRNETEAQVTHGQRHERLQAIQQELAQLADLGRRVLSVEQLKEQHRSRPYNATINEACLDSPLLDSVEPAAQQQQTIETQAAPKRLVAVQDPTS